MSDHGPPLLSVTSLEACYGDSQALYGMTFSARRGEIVTLLGRNGAGKSTTIRSVIGLLRPIAGSVVFDGVETARLSANAIARLGIAYCPEERGIFASLTVKENLELPPVVKPGGLAGGEIDRLFPALRVRSASQGTKLSGGEQQMLALARVLRTGASLFLLDEPTEGLAPVIVKQIAAVVRALKRRGCTVLLVEQNFRFASTVADRHYLVERGRVVDMILNDEIGANVGTLEKCLGI